VLIVRRGVLILLTIVLVGYTYAGGKAKGLDRAVPERHRVYGIPVAVSQDVYGLNGYVSYFEIARRFFNDKSIDTILSQDLPKAANGKRVAEAVEDREHLFFIPADDKGDVTFTRMAFATFGLKLDSLYKLYFLLLLGSVAAFATVFYADIPKLLVGVCVLISMFALMSAFQDGLLRPHVVTFYDVRVFGVVAVLAAFHVAFISASNRKMSPVQIAATLYQILVILLAVHVRADNIWLVCAIVAWVGVSVFPGLSYRQLWPLATMAVIGGLFLAWERVTYHPKYFSTNLSHHLLWHNVAMGFALHPQLGKPYHFQISDEATMRRVAQYLVAANSSGTIAKVFGPAYSNATGTPEGATVSVETFLNGASSDLNLYNQMARRIVLETARTHPLQTAKLFLYYKPRYILSHLLWFTAFLTYDQPFLDATGHESALLRAPGDVRTRLIYFTPLPARGVLMLLLAFVAASPLPLREARKMLIAALGLFAFSLLPSLAAYPAPFLMGETLFALTFVMCAGVVIAARAISSIQWKSAASIVADFAREAE